MANSQPFRHGESRDANAQKASDIGDDSLILAATGAGVHAGTLSRLVLDGKVRKFFDGPVARSDAIANGTAVLDAQGKVTNFAYIRSRWLTVKESRIKYQYRRKPGQGACLIDDIANDNDLVEHLKMEYGIAKNRLLIQGDPSKVAISIAKNVMTN